jgi:hypothetical protein
MKAAIILLAICAISLLVILGYVIAQQQSTELRDELTAVKATLDHPWEYRIEAPIDRDFTERMNQLGADGWDIVSLRRVETTDADLPAFKRGYQPAPGATQDQFEVAVRLQADKMKYEVVLKRPKR